MRTMNAVEEYQIDIKNPTNFLPLSLKTVQPAIDIMALSMTGLSSEENSPDNQTCLSKSPSGGVTIER